MRDKRSACDNPYHPATGHVLGDRMQLCGPCTRHFVAFVKSHTKRKWGGVDFYAHAATSVKAPEPCGWCGATDGYSTDYDGWPRCNSCQGC